MESPAPRTRPPVRSSGAAGIPRMSRAPARPDRQVIVVGAGPAGMQCAMVLGRRGLRHVRLVEARPEIGGSVNYVARLPGLGEWSRLVTYRANQLRKLATSR